MATIKQHSRTEVSRLAQDLDDMWSLIDRLLDSVPNGGWERRYGPDWTLADLPWHLAYFDRVMVAEAIEAGRALPETAQFNLRTMREVNDWNAAEFAKRPAGQTGPDSVGELRAVHDRIRRHLASMVDEDLERPCFNHFFGAGFETLRTGLKGALLHSWGEGTELLVRLGRKDPVPAAATRNACEGYVHFMTATLDRGPASDAPFTILMDFTGPGGGPYAIHVEDRRARLVAGRPRHPDLTFRLDPITFNSVMIRKMQSPVLAMLTGKIRVKGLSKMGRMGKVFPEPGLDQALSGSLFGA